jgi:hypothetical protein
MMAVKEAFVRTVFLFVVGVEEDIRSAFATLFCRRLKPSLSATRSDPSLEIRAQMNLSRPNRLFARRNIVRADALIVEKTTRDIYFLFFSNELLVSKSLHILLRGENADDDDDDDDENDNHANVTFKIASLHPTVPLLLFENGTAARGSEKSLFGRFHRTRRVRDSILVQNGPRERAERGEHERRAVREQR